MITSRQSKQNTDVLLLQAQLVLLLFMFTGRPDTPYSCPKCGENSKLAPFPFECTFLLNLSFLCLIILMKTIVQL